jgi:hypothetical protein
MLAQAMQGAVPSSFDNLCLRFDGALRPARIEKIIAGVRKNPPRTGPVFHENRLLEELKFSACVPRRLAEQTLELRLADTSAVVTVLEQPIRYVHA